MCQRLGTAQRAGVDILATLRRESGYGSLVYRRNMAEVFESVSGGATLAEAMRERSPYFPPLTCELVDVGEQTGNLESILLRLSEHYQHLLRLRRTFLIGIFWPVLQLTVAILVIGLLILLLGILGTSTTFFGLSGIGGVIIYAIVVGSCIVAVGLLGFGLLRGWFGAWPEHLLMRMPVVGKTLQTMALARLAWTLSLALNAGIDAGRAIRMALQSTQSGYYIRHAAEIEAVIIRGGQFHEALRGTGVFSDEFLTALETAELTGTESESLAHLSEDYQRRAETATLALAVAASVMIWALVAAMMIYVIFRLFFTLYLNPMNEALEMLAIARLGP
ncbi:MAG: type II secretion system F family protein [Pirellulaceae bacterium]